MKPYVVFAPGPEVLEDKRAWQGCPTIARTRGGRLFAGWYTGGAFEPCITNFNVLVQSDDNGESWSKPILAVYADTEKRIRNIDIQLWVDESNRLWVMWTHSPYYETSKEATIRTNTPWDYHREFTGVEAMICNDPDAEVLRWEEPRRICDGFLRCKPIITKKGEYLFPAYDWIHADRYMLRFSSDRGETFRNIVAAKKPQNEVYDETMAYEVGDKLCIHARTNLGYYSYAESLDGGETWSETTEYEKAPSTRFYLARLSSGELVYVRNISDTARTGMKVCLSEDDGKTWPYQLVLDTRESVSYPDLAEGEEGVLYIVHDRERDNRAHLNRETWTSKAAKEILLSRVTVADIRRGKLGEGSYVARVISKGGMDYVEK